MTCMHATLGRYEGVLEHFLLFFPNFILRNKTIYFYELGISAIPLPVLGMDALTLTPCIIVLADIGIMDL